MCALVVVCIVSTKKAQQLQTDLHLRDRNATMASGFGGSMGVRRNFSRGGKADILHIFL